MKIRRWMKWTAAGLLTCGLAGVLWVQHADAGPLGGGHRGDGRFLETIAGLGITDEQRDQIRAILREAKPTAEPLVKRVVAERRALRDLVRHGGTEAEIRSQVNKVAAAVSELVVLKARIAPQVRGVLTPEQQERVAEMIAEFDERVDAWLDHAGNIP